jgi:sporulation protein YlmC with PRC-barrel domain
MAEITLAIGSEAHFTDNKVAGEVKCVVVARKTRTVTDLVVEPKGREGLARLVPLDHVDASTGKIRLRYTEAEFKKLSAAEETLAEIFGAGPVELVTEGWRPADDDRLVVDGSKISPVRAAITGETDLVPWLRPNEDEEHRGDHVHATDGDIGQLRALCIDPGTHQVTHVHVLLKEGLLWRHKEVAIPSDEVSEFAAGIHLNISKQQVQDLAHGGVDHPIG